VNLLPQPRSVEMGEGLVTAREPVVRVDPSLPAEGYALTIGPDEVAVVADDDAGEFYARATLDQLTDEHGGRLPACTIRDWPDLPVRGVMLDISRDKVPTMETLKAQVARLASWKVNHVQLYTEHTFAYRHHGEVWAKASPLTADDVRELDRFCRDHHVELAPNQNCLGHMGRWLAHDRYRPLAIAPDGWEERGRWRAPTTVDPTKPASLELVQELLGELLPCFTSRRVHVGLDEPWEMPAERIDDYLAWVRTLRGLPELAGREMLIWGDILDGRRDRIDRLPDGVTVCEWGYDDWYPFEQRAATFEAAGQPFWVCPGTSSWLTILGRVTNMRGNCAAAAAAALAHLGSEGFLNTDWGDLGHLQYLPVSEPGFAYGAAVSWCLEANRDLDLAEALSAHAYGDPTGELGRALVTLGDVHLGITPQFPNLSTLVLHLYYPQLQVGRSFTEGVTTEELLAVEDRLAAAVDTLDRARPRRSDGALVLDELRAAAALVALLCRDARERLAADGWLSSVPEERRRELAADLRPLVHTHRELWLARNRPGGLDDSTAWLEHLLHCYETGVTEKAWGGW